MKQFLETKLANGLKIIGEYNPNAKSTAIGYFVNTGSRDETPAEAGISHFLEHMMFKGTARRGALDVTYDLGKLGAQANAYTNEEHTVYYGIVVSKYWEQYLELLSDMLRPSLDQHEFDTEKNVILEEIALYKDRPSFYLYEHAINDFYQKHTLGNSVLGSTESVSAITSEQMRNYFERRYAPSNMVLVVSGNFDWNRFIDLAKEYTQHWQDRKCLRELNSHKSPQIKKCYTKKDLNQCHLYLLTDSACVMDSERYPLAVLANMLGDSSGSKLYWELVDPGLVDSVDCDSDERNGAGTFSVYLACDPDKLDLVRDLTYKVLEQKLNFTDQELSSAKAKIATRIIMSGESTMGRLMSLGSSWLYRGEVEPLSQIKNKIESVTREQIFAACDKFPLKSWSEFVLAPQTA